tara:strand:+ start:119 stop:328 length:210 start_codon:yes stop_codon:yes gene_type:complete
VGDSITFQKQSGTHPVVFNSVPATVTANLYGGTATYTTPPFTVSGRYEYYCQYHGNSNGNGMSGVINVV